MTLTLRRTKEGLIPLDDKSVEAIKKVKLGDDILAEYKPRRNVANHRRYFSLLNNVIHNQEYYKNVDNLLDVIKLKTGHFKTVVTHKGEQMYIPQSIAFHAMSEDEFQEFFSETIDVLLEFMPEDSVNMIINYA